MKRAIVVGASSGMGREVAKLLLRDEWQVGIMARRAEPLLELKAEYPALVEVETCDVNAEEAPQKLLNLIDRMGGVELYFHASGIGKQNETLEPTIESNTVQTNVQGFTRMIDTIFRYMADNQGGHIAVISSIAGVKGLGPAPSYSASKAFQNTYIQALEQLANNRRLNIRFTDIRPGFVDTPLLKGSRYPMEMDKVKTAKAIVKAIYANKHVRVIDWKYRIMVFFWRLLPPCLWRRLVLTKKQ
ncbi:MAG: SDR family NAD(P)-dependent oxidoreductase [Prevotella sp.]|jgi:short-subunit dehydrogenase|nr:SDR family NAD(P)-dependent oxidoreductase [Prevotella sp.]MCI1281803.1 SDR family NAD(P)-dependent oxidoreductase [Prevotella sp.]